MNNHNPFLRLKHFHPDKEDPKENHATECLAACLAWSPRIAAEFVRFLFRDNVPFALDEAAQIDVSAQESAEPYGCMDLVLRIGKQCTLVVEVKVAAPENCDHHKNQLKNYHEWLSTQDNGKLFTLVRTRDLRFEKPDYVEARLKWMGLYERLKRLETQMTVPCEANLLSSFCEYLESEGIVMIYSTAELLNYGKGIRAKAALSQVFGSLREMLAAKYKLDLETEIAIFLDQQPPRLEVGKIAWKAFFPQGGLRRIKLHFVYEGVWDHKSDEFLTEIRLWSIGDGDADWNTRRKMFSHWAEFIYGMTKDMRALVDKRTWKTGREAIDFICSGGDATRAPKWIGSFKTRDPSKHDMDALTEVLFHDIEEALTLVEQLS